MKIPYSVDIPSSLKRNACSKFPLFFFKCISQSFHITRPSAGLRSPKHPARRPAPCEQISRCDSYGPSITVHETEADPRPKAPSQDHTYQDTSLPPPLMGMAHYPPPPTGMVMSPATDRATACGHFPPPDSHPPPNLLSFSSTSLPPAQ